MNNAVLAGKDASQAVFPKEELVPKGVWIRESFQDILNWLAEQQYREQCYVVFIDGSGKIDFGSAVDVLDCLSNGHELALGLRSDPTITQSKDRVTVETFENYLVEQRFHVTLPDAQCGCWGVCGRAMAKLPLIALSYSIELDLLIMGLSGGFSPRFVQVKLVPPQTGSPGISDFNSSEQDLHKIQFLMYRLELGVEMLPTYIANFEKEKGLTLPSGYKKLLLEEAKPVPKATTQKFSVYEPGKPTQ